jgi:DNA-directed RNA polymerase specialized sigma subunit
VDSNLRTGQRWVMNPRNLARVVEARTYKDIGAYKNAVSILDDQFGRPPNTQEVADYLGWPEKHAALVQSEIHPTLSSSYWEKSEGSVDPTSIMPSRHSEVLTNIQYQLSPEELNVYEYLLGRNGKPKLKQNEIATTLGFSQSKVSRLKHSIGKKMAGYI